MQYKQLSRRDFLKIAGIAGATIGVGAGLGSLVVGCGEEEVTTSTTAVETTITAGQSTTTQAAGTTTSVGAEQGRPVKVGLISPKTGAFAAFAVPLDYLLTRWKEAVTDGVVLADGKNHSFEILVEDTQSDSNRAAQVTGDLIQNSQVDVVLSFGSAETVNPSADQCEAMGMPSLSMFCPWEPFFFGRGATPDKPFRWTYLANPGVSDFVSVEINMYDKIATNKKVGLFYQNTVDGQAQMNEQSGLPPYLDKAGYSRVFPGFYTPGQEDFTKEIAEFKKAGCELAVGAPSPADFANFWRQCLQQGFNPKVVAMGMALLFPQTLEAVGSSAYNVIVELGWHPAFPYTSTLTGETCQQVADDYEAKTGNQWTMPLGLYSLFEWAVDVFKRTKDIDDKEAILAAVASTRISALMQAFDFTTPPGSPGHPVQNVAYGSVAGGQWVKGKGKWPFDLEIVDNSHGPDLPLTAEMQPMQYE